MARTRNPENMSFAELNKLSARVNRLMAAKRNDTRAELRARIAKLAKSEGMSLEYVLGGRGSRGKGSVAIKYRDPSNPQNVWTGRGRMPRWMVAAMKGGKAKKKKEDFLI
jgi:DNA-binding protein H-NS